MDVRMSKVHVWTNFFLPHVPNFQQVVYQCLFIYQHLWMSKVSRQRQNLNIGIDVILGLRIAWNTMFWLDFKDCDSISIWLKLTTETLVLIHSMVYNLFYDPFERRRGILLCTCPSVGRYVGRVGMSVSLNLAQLITQEGFAPETSKVVGR